MLTGVMQEIAYFSGFARLMARRRGGAGVILRMERVRPARRDAFQPLKSREITPVFLDAVLRKLRSWKYDIVSIDEACRRAGEPRPDRRFACLTFDGGYKDVIVHAYPVLTRHDAPFAVYLPTAFPDGLGQAWWLALERIIATHDRIALMMDNTERHFSVAEMPEKHQLYDFLERWMRALAPHELTVAIHDLCSRYSIDLAVLSRAASMDWNDVTALAADPRVTIGTSTVNYPVLHNLGDAEALREISMGQAVMRAALGRDPTHFSYPFGDGESFDPRHVAMTKELGFRSAVTAQAGVVEADGRSDLHALPRIALDGRRRSLRTLRVRLSGVCVAEPDAR